MNIIKRIYYKISELLFHLQIKDMGKNCKLRLQIRLLSADYIHFADGVEIEKGGTIACYPEFGGMQNPVKSGGGVYLGKNGSYNRNLTIYCADTVRIGENVLFGSNVLVTDNEHGTDPDCTQAYRLQPLKTSPVEIGDGCWVAENAKILAGSKIGEKCIIAANAVVKGVFPARCIIAGVPGRIVRIWDNTHHAWVKPDVSK